MVYLNMQFIIHCFLSNYIKKLRLHLIPFIAKMAADVSFFSPKRWSRPQAFPVSRKIPYTRNGRFQLFSDVRRLKTAVSDFRPFRGSLK